MGQSLIKNPRKIFSLSGGDPSHENRITILENNEYKITYFAEISNSTGTITIPTGATILLDQFQGGVDAYVCTIQNGQPTGDFPQTGLGVTVDVTSFNALGDYTLSDTPSSYPVALIYILKIKAKDYSNLDITKILDLEDIVIISQTIRDGVTTSAPSEDAVFDALALKVDSNDTRLTQAVRTIYKDFTAGAALTGTTSITLINSALIPANTVAVGNEVEIYARAQRSTNTGTASQYLYYNTSASLSGATLMATTSLATAYFVTQRRLFVKASNDAEILNSSANVSLDTSAATTSVTSLNINLTVNQYIIQAFQNAANGDSTTSRAIIIKLS